MRRFGIARLSRIFGIVNLFRFMTFFKIYELSRVVRLFGLISLLALLSTASLAEDLMFFADDHYKAIGAPKIEASAVNSVTVPGDAVLRVLLANNGQVEELVPINSSGSREDLAAEMKEEMKCADALNLQAELEGSGPVKVTSGPQAIEFLPSGGQAELLFNITLGNDANGWYELPLLLSYEHQVDASVSAGEVSPLYQPENSTPLVMVFVQGREGPLRVSCTRSDLAAGGSGTVLAVIENDGSKTLKNCTARLVAVPPFHAEGTHYPLGDLALGSPAMASFPVSVDGNASLEDYQLGCEVSFEGGRALLSIPVSLVGSGWPFWRNPWGLIPWHPTMMMSIIILIVSIILMTAATVTIFFKRQRPSRRRRWG